MYYFIVAFIFLVIFLIASAVFLANDRMSDESDYVAFSFFSLTGAVLWPISTIICMAWLAAIGLLKLFSGILAKREVE